MCKVCKYESAKDPDYLKVRNYIKSRIANALIPQKSRKSPSISTEDGLEDKKLEILFGLNDPPDSDFIFFKDRCLQGTCTWILEDKTFLEWLADETLKPRVLWFRGTAGTGKSIITSYVIDHLVQQRSDCQYFFIRFDDAKKRSLSNLLRSLAFQIALSSPSYRKRILRLSDEASQLRKADAQSVWQRLFREILFKVEIISPMYWIIDGLDECDTPRRLIKMINELSTTALPIRVMIVSRKQRDLATEFSRLEGQVQVDTISCEGRAEDFDKYVDLELDVPGSTTYRRMIAKKIVERAHGNFLWVHLAVRKINACQTAAKREVALDQLPPGMDKFFDRMGQSIADIEDEDNKNLAKDILTWATCSIRGLTLIELLQALNMSASAMPDLQRSIEDLCAGFVVVDNSGNVSLIHKSAKEYLIGSAQNRPFFIDREQVNEKIFIRCITCITTPGLRAKIRTRSTPKFLDYAATSWYAHLSASFHGSETLLATLNQFLRTNAILIWIQALAAMDMVSVMIRASNYLTAYAAKRRESEWDMAPRDRQITERENIEEWATDIIKIAGRFGSKLANYPESIYKLIPPFCPLESRVYQTFGAKEYRSLSIAGLSSTVWDDSLARLQFGAKTYVSAILAAGNCIATLVPSGTVLLFHSNTFEKVGQLDHGERISKMQRSASATMLVTYGYATTRVWDLISRQQSFAVSNPDSRPQALCLTFVNDDEKLLLGGDDRIIRTLSLNETEPSWDVVIELSQEPIEGAIVNSPSAMAISPDGKLVVLGYRAHPVSVWTLEGDHVGVGFRDGSRNLKGRTMTTECLQLMWYPHASACQIFGLYEDGIVFRWNPIDEEYFELATQAGTLTISQDGRFLATGDRAGRVKVYSAPELELVYQLRSKDCVFDLAFSPTAGRFYDIRGQYANVWEPTALMRLSEQEERGSDSASDAGSIMPPTSVISEVVAARLDPITAVASQPHGRLYCCGTQDGMIELFDALKGQVYSVGKSTAFFTAEKIVWSQDGRHVAYAWLNTLMLSTVIHGTDNKSWRTENILLKPIRLSGAVNELLFSSDAERLLVYTMVGVDVISLVEKKVIISRRLNGPMLRWINHPSDSTLLLAISYDTINILDWDTLLDKQTLTFPTPEGDHFDEPVNKSDLSSPHICPNQMDSTRRKSSTTPLLWKSRKAIERVLVTQDKLHILVQISIPVNKDKKEKHLLLFNVTNLLVDQADSILDFTESISLTGHAFSNESSSRPTERRTIKPAQLPAEAVSRIDIPLSFISGSTRREPDRLIFLDHENWVSSWHLSLANDATSRPSVGESGINVVQHYFLPGDWISPDCVALATVMADGTLLIPRNGEVAVVKCESVGR